MAPSAPVCPAQIAITVLYIGRFYLETNFFSVLVALQVLLLWIKVQYFARCVTFCLAQACPLQVQLTDVFCEHRHEI